MHTCKWVEETEVLPGHIHQHQRQAMSQTNSQTQFKEHRNTQKLYATTVAKPTKQEKLAINTKRRVQQLLAMVLYHINVRNVNGNSHESMR